MSKIINVTIKFYRSKYSTINFLLCSFTVREWIIWLNKIFFIFSAQSRWENYYLLSGDSSTPPSLWPGPETRCPSCKCLSASFTFGQRSHKYEHHFLTLTLMCFLIRETQFWVKFLWSYQNTNFLSFCFVALYFYIMYVQWSASSYLVSKSREIFWLVSSLSVSR